MAYGYATHPSFVPRVRREYACVGVPPEKEVSPEPARNGAMLAAIARVLRSTFGVSVEPADRGLVPELERR